MTRHLPATIVVLRSRMKLLLQSSPHIQDVVVAQGDRNFLMTPDPDNSRISVESKIPDWSTGLLGSRPSRVLISPVRLFVPAFYRISASSDILGALSTAWLRWRTVSSIPWWDSLLPSRNPAGNTKNIVNKRVCSRIAVIEIDKKGILGINNGVVLFIVLVSIVSKVDNRCHLPWLCLHLFCFSLSKLLGLHLKNSSYLEY